MPSIQELELSPLIVVTDSYEAICLLTNSVTILLKILKPHLSKTIVQT